MCRFKSGIILKTRCVVADGVNDSHSDLLDGLGIEDTEINAMTKFVRVELLPPNNEWWTDPDRWKINIDQDILPDWYKEDKEKYNEDFRKEVKEWCNKHVLVDKNIRELKEGYYLLKDCDVVVLANNAVVVLYNATVQEMNGNATVKRMNDNAMVQEMNNNATVKEMYGNATVKRMNGNATVQRICDNAKVFSYKGLKIKEYVSADSNIEVVVHSGGEVR